MEEGYDGVEMLTSWQSESRKREEEAGDKTYPLKAYFW
jgi:hypothetical protein